MTLPIIQSLWIGESLSVMEQLCVSSFLKNGHSFHLYVYDEVKGIPENAVIKDASEIIPPDKIFKYTEHDSYSGFSNIFRYKLLMEKGGYWVDTDIICLKPFNNESEYVFASERTENPEINHIATCVIKAPANSVIMEYCYNKSIEKDHVKLKWGEIGPRLLHQAVQQFDMEQFVACPEKFCHVHWLDWRFFINEPNEEDYLTTSLRNSNAVHLWNEMWRREQVDKSGNFPKSCIYEQLKNMYLNN